LRDVADCVHDNGWVEGILNGLEQLHPINNNIEYTYNEFLARFEAQFADSTKQEMAQASLDRLQFKFPAIDQYISDFEMLARKAGYTIGSRELMTLFIRGLGGAPDVVERVINKSPEDYFDLKTKVIAVVKNCQLLRAMRNTSTPFRPTPQFQQRPYRPPQTFNSSNAPRSINNLPVPMDLSRSRFPPRGRGQGRPQGRANVTQMENRYDTPKPRVRKCYNCDKPRHFAAECRAPKQIRQGHVANYMDQPEDLSHVQPEMHPHNLLDNALKTFDALPVEQKDALIAQYEGKQEDFPAV